MDYFFWELEARVDRAIETSQLKKTSLLSKDVSTILKHQVSQVLGNEIDKLEKSNLMENAVSVISAGMVAVSAYAYLV